MNWQQAPAPSSWPRSCRSRLRERQQNTRATTPSSPNGQKMLASYAKGVEAMLKLPADDPRNWFRNAFIHLMDCPHGNWWFYVWHRGYRRLLRAAPFANLSGDRQLRASVLGLDAAAADPRGDVRRRADADRPGVRALHEQPRAVHLVHQADACQNTSTRSPRRSKAQLNDQGLHDIRQASGTMSPASVRCRSERCRHFGKHGLRDHLRVALSLARQPEIRQERPPTTSPSSSSIRGCCRPISTTRSASLSFTSSKTASHNAPPGTFSTLEGMPHNQVHNYIGGVGPLDPGPMAT